MNIRPVNLINESDAINLVQAMGEAQDRMRERERPEPHLPACSVVRTFSKPAPAVEVSLSTADVTAHENALWRALVAKFPPDKATEMVLRARLAGRAR